MPSLRAGLLTLLLLRQILHKSPVAARVNVNVADVLFDDHHVRLVQEWKHRHIAANNLLGLRIKWTGDRVDVGVLSIVKDLIQFRITVTAAIEAAGLAGNF